MRRSRPRSSFDLDAVDVLLVEDEDADVAADEVTTLLHELAADSLAWRATWPGEPERPSALEAVVDRPEPPGLAVRLARRYRRRAVACAVLALGVGATTSVVDARQAAARAAAFAAMPAVLAAAPGPPSVAWRVPGRVVSDEDDRLLVVDGATLRAVDPATGNALWTASDEAGRAASVGGCFAVDESLRPDRAPADDGGGPRDLVACVAAAPVGGPASGAETGARVVVVDSTTGRTRHAVTTDGAPLLVEPVGRDLLVAAARSDGRVRVTRWDLAAGAPAWDRVSPQPVLTGGAADVVERRARSLTVNAFAVDLASGDEIDAAAERRRPYPYGEAILPGGARASWSWRDGGTFRLGRVAGGDASASYTLPGPPLRPRVTDDSDAGVLVVRPARGDRLRGLHLRTGRLRWTQPYPATSSLHATALVDGVLLVDDADTVTALDVRTGTSLWRARVEPTATGGAAITDGEVVLLPLREAGGALQLVAHRIADGAVRWRARMAPGTLAVTVVDHRLVASTHGEVIGLT